MKNLKIQVSAIPPIEKDIKKLLLDILNDYCKRFNVTCTTNKTEIHISFINYEEYISSGLATHAPDYNKIMVQIGDPFLTSVNSDDFSVEPNSYTLTTFICTICHELVHVCQYLTGRKGSALKGNHNKDDPIEGYYFDPAEVEARALESFYRAKYGQKLYD
jgi:hypothetical protein